MTTFGSDDCLYCGKPLSGHQAGDYCDETCRAAAQLPSGEAYSHQLVLEEALQLFIKRDKVYGGLWKEYGAKDSAGHCVSKALRLRKLLETGDNVGPEVEDSALDLINYAVFALRNVREGRLDGHHQSG